MYYFASCDESWVIDSFFPDSDLAKLLQLGIYNSRNWAEDAIDMEIEAPKLSSGDQDKIKR